VLFLYQSGKNLNHYLLNYIALCHYSILLYFIIDFIECIYYHNFIKLIHPHHMGCLGSRDTFTVVYRININIHSYSLIFWL
jgi:hypothetical protein